jgi:single-stranded-DNA-specific exonuclease
LNQRWLEPQKYQLPESYRAAIGGHLLVAQILFDRGLESVDAACAFLDPEAFCSVSPGDIPGINEAASRLERAIQKGERICVWGDFDVDGQTSTTLLVATLRELGAQVSFHIPVRERESHGVSLPVFKKIHDQQGFSLVLTCDTGIAAHAAIDYANSIGVDFVITDHHELPDKLPPAIAIANPRLLPHNHPSAGLPGVGLAYKLAQALYQSLSKTENAEKHLDLVALGIVADVANQTGETRYLLQRGLKVLRNPIRIGLKALFEIAELDPSGITEEHIGFLLAPRLNALGRLSDANSIVEFLTTPDIGRARVLANQLEGLNARRKLLTDQVFQAVQSSLERDPALLKEAALVLSNPAWPAGVIGIVASRLVERYNRPVILISAPAGEAARGSARSIPGCNITTAITAHASLLLGYGGHAMAAGLSLEPERIPEFKRALCRTVGEMLGEGGYEPCLQIDGYVPISELTPDLVLDFERLAPFGAGNPPITLCSSGLRLNSTSSIGKGDDHIQLNIEDEQANRYKLIWWQGANWNLPEAARVGEAFDLAYHVRIGNYRGKREIQIQYVDMRLKAESSETIHLSSEPIQVIDYRSLPHPLPRLKQILESGVVAVWGEADALELLPNHGLPVQDRYALQPAPTLAIWTVPPGRSELEAVLEAVSPGCVYLFGIQPATEKTGAFLKRLAGLVKFGIRSKGGHMSITRLAAATAHREATIHKGLGWLEAAGHIQVLAHHEDEIHVSAGNGVIKVDKAAVERQINELLQETAAFRKHFLSANTSSLVEYPL